MIKIKIKLKLNILCYKHYISYIILIYIILKYLTVPNINFFVILSIKNLC